MIRRALRAEGFKVSEAYVENCAAAFERCRPDVVLLAESADGYRAARELRRVESGRRALIVAAASADAPMSPEAARDAGVDQLWSGPHEFDHVRRHAVLMASYLQARLADQEALETAQDAMRSQIEEAHEAAASSMRARAEFLAAMSHELRTPLNGILGVIDLLREGSASEDVDELLETADASAHRLTTLVNDVLDFSKLASGILTIESSEFSLNKVLREVVDLVSADCREKDLEFETRIELGGNDWVCGDPSRVSQVLLNLIGNAIKFTESGRVSLVVDGADCGEESRLIRFEVEDTGIGVPQEDVDGLFRGFSQADGSRTRRFDGSGLGLAISKGLAEAMGGEIGAESARGVGSRFWFTIRVGFAQRYARPQAVRRADTPEGSLEGMRILVAEDNRANQLVIRRILERFGAVVHVVGNGIQAVDASGIETWDAILMDQHMPELDGVDAAMRIRSVDGPNRSTPILAVTASVLEEDRLRCAQAGMCRFLTKPLVAHELCSVLREVVSDCRWSREPVGPTDSSNAA